MFAQECAAFVPWVAERFDQLIEIASEALALSRSLKTDRYTYLLMVCEVIALRHRKPHAELVAQCREALELAQRTSLTFAGPMIYAAWAQVEPDAGRQAELIGEGEALLQKTGLAHNHTFFYRLAIDWALEHGHWSEAERFADALAAYFAAREALPYIDLLANRGRVLAALGRNPTDTDALRRLAELQDIARSHGLQTPFPPLND
jgi:tetratricopeptide (TPR) repeat protein